MKTQLVLDVETTLADKNEKAIFDLGWVVMDEKWEVVKTESYVIEEIFLDMKMMKRAHYFVKYPQYVLDLISGKRKMLPWAKVKEKLLNDYNNAEKGYAYNSGFDMGALNDTSMILDNEPLEIDLDCIMVGAMSTFMRTRDFITTAYTQDWLKPTGNINTGAEFAYRYITGDYEFIEEHTGLEDALIEMRILKEVQSFADYETTVGKYNWKYIQEYRKELGFKRIVREVKKVKKEREYIHIGSAKSEVIKLKDKTITIQVEERE